MSVELLEQQSGDGSLEVVSGLLDFVLMKDIAVAHAPERTVGPDEVIHALDTLQIHCETLEPVGDFARDGPAVETTGLLEVGELRDFHAVEPHLPAEAPSAERRRFPVVFDEANVVRERIEAERAQRSEIAIEDVERRGFDDDLELVVVLEAKWIVAVAAVARTPARLHVGCTPG